MRDIGLMIEAPNNSCNDSKCPFHGSLSVRGQVFQGIVARDKMENAVIMRIQYRKYSHKYERFWKQTRNFPAHNPPCIGAKIGDIVIASECRPLSKTISKVVIQKISHAKYIKVNPLWNLNIDKNFLIDQLNDSIKEIKNDLYSKRFKPNELSGLLNQLAICQKNLFYIKGDIFKLNEAIANFKQALSNSEENPSEKLEIYNNLGIALTDLYYNSKDLSILSEAINTFDQALDGANGRAPYFDILLTNLSDSKKERYARTGSIIDLKDAIDGYRKILKPNPKKTPMRYTLVESLSDMLSDYCKINNSYSYLNEAISLITDALASLSCDSNLHEPSLWIDLGNLYSDGYKNFKHELSDSEIKQILDNAITAYRKAKQLLQNNPNNLSIALNNLANAQRDVYIQTKEIQFLKEAILNWDESLKNTAPESQHFKVHSNNLAIGYLTLYEAEGNDDYLKRSTSILENIRNVL